MTEPQVVPRKHAVSFNPECVLIPEVAWQDRPRLTMRKYSVPLTSRAPSAYHDDPTFTPNPPSAHKSISLHIPHFTRAPSMPSPSGSSRGGPLISPASSTASNGSHGFGSPKAGTGSGSGTGFPGFGKRRNSRSDSESEGPPPSSMTSGGGGISWGLNRVRSRSRSIDRGSGNGPPPGLVGCLKKPGGLAGPEGGLARGQTVERRASIGSSTPVKIPGGNNRYPPPSPSSSTSSLPTSAAYLSLSPTLARIGTNIEPGVGIQPGETNMGGWALPTPTLSTVNEMGGTATPPNGLAEGSGSKDKGTRPLIEIPEATSSATSGPPSPGSTYPDSAPGTTSTLSFPSSPATIFSRMLHFPSASSSAHAQPFYSSSSASYGKSSQESRSSTGSGSRSKSAGSGSASGSSSGTGMAVNLSPRPGLRGRTSSILTRITSRELATVGGSPVGSTSASANAAGVSAGGGSFGFGLRRTTSQLSNSGSSSQTQPRPDTASPESTTDTKVVPLSSCCSKCLKAANRGLRPASEWEIGFSSSAKRKIARDQGLDGFGPGGKSSGTGMRIMEGGSLAGLAGQGLGKVVGVAGGAASVLDPVEPTRSSLFSDETPFGPSRASGSLHPPDEADEREDDEEEEAVADSALSARIKRMGSVDEVERVIRQRESNRGESAAQGTLAESDDAWITSKLHSPNEPSNPSLPTPTPRIPSAPSTPIEHPLSPDELIEVDRLPDQAHSYFAEKPSKPPPGGLNGKKIGVGGGLPVFSQPKSPSESVKSSKFSWFGAGGAKSVPF